MLSDLSTDAAVLLNFESSAQLYCLVLVLGNVISMHPCRSALLRRFTSRAEDGVQILAHLKKAVFGSFERRALLTLFGTEYDTCETLGRCPTRSAPNSAPAHETHLLCHRECSYVYNRSTLAPTSTCSSISLCPPTGKAGCPIS
jgi:hypothetical protein